jgi:hypothetical protein
MKKISLLFVGVLFCTLVFANGTDDPSASTSSVAVTNATGSSLFKLYYTANVADDVKVSIISSKGKVVFSETIKKIKGFIRPYNFNGLDVGEYAIQIENAAGKKIEKVYYGAGKIDKLVNVVKLADHGKYLFTVKSKTADNVNVNIYDANNQLIHTQKKYIDKEFAEVFNLKNINAFTIEVTDKNGLVKTMKYDK